MDNQVSQKKNPRSPDDISQELLERCDKIDLMLKTEGWGVIEKDIRKEITDSYGRLANGDKEKFDEAKGYLRGVQYTLNLVKTYLDKRKSFLRN